MATALLRRLEACYDAIPREAGSQAQDVGPLVVFHGSRPLSPSYARPRLTAPDAAPTHLTVADVDAARSRQRALGVTETLEWVAEVTPSLEPAAVASGFRVERCPLMVLDPAHLPRPTPADVHLLDPADDDFALRVAESWAVAEIAFAGDSHAGTDTDAADVAGVMALVDPARALAMAEAHWNGHLREAVAYGPAGEVVARGSWQSGLGAAEIVGVATLPSHRGHGLATRVSAVLARSALDAGHDLVFLSAADDRVASIYARIGFTRVGTACIAELP